MDYTKQNAGLALLMSANAFIPCAEDGEDAIFEVNYNGKRLLCTMTEEGEPEPVYQCTCRGYVSVESAAGILITAFDSVDLPAPVDLIEQYKRFVCGEEEA